MTRKITKYNANIFLDLGFPPHEASVMLLRVQLAEALRSWMEREELTQAQAAKRLGIAQLRMSEIVRGKVELMSLEAPRIFCWPGQLRGASRFTSGMSTCPAWSATSSACAPGFARAATIFRKPTSGAATTTAA